MVSHPGAHRSLMRRKTRAMPFLASVVTTAHFLAHLAVLARGELGANLDPGWWLGSTRPWAVETGICCNRQARAATHTRAQNVISTLA